MTFNKKIKTMAATAALLAGVVGGAAVVQAQPQIIVATLTTSSTITTALVRGMGFGTWFTLFRNADVFELVMDPTTGTVTAANALGGATNSNAIELVGVDETGQITVSLPVGANGLIINMQRGAITDFTDIALTLANIRYDTATEAPTLLPASTNFPVTVITGGTPELINYGGEVQVTGQPADLAHTASYTVTVAF